MKNEILLRWLDEIVENKLPVTELTPFEYGVLAGQTMLVDKIKVILTQDIIEEEIV